MAKEYNNLFHSKALQNLSKLGFLVKNIPSGNPGRHTKQSSRLSSQKQIKKRR
jgi:hypothetical protein